jgi:ABC-type uncharacterized transport system permease subunit
VAATVAIIDRGAAGDLFFRVVDVTLDGSYPAGGYPLAAKDLGFGTNGLVYMVDPGTVSKTGGWLAGFDSTNSKLQVFDASSAVNVALHEVAAATVLTGVVVRLLAFGKGQG